MIDDNDLRPGQAVDVPATAPENETRTAVDSLESPIEDQDRPGEDASSASRRIRLRPSADESKLKAIPSLPQSSDADRAPAPSEGAVSAAAPHSAPAEAAHATAPESARPTTTAEPGTGDAAPAGTGDAGEKGETGETGEQAAPVRSAAAPVAVPPVIKDLDAQLEAEIEAAMASGELDAIADEKGTADEESVHADKPPEESLEPGHHLTGRIQTIHGDGVFLDLGYRAPGVVPLRQFVSGKKPEVGQLIEVLVDRVAHDEGLIHLNLPKGLRRIAGNWESLSKGQVVDCLVNRTNKGGLEVTVSGLRGFLPSSQIDFGFVADLTPYVGQKLRVTVVESNPRKRNLVVSRRAYLQIERQEAEQQLWQTLAVGQTFAGRVKTIKDYGAFVDLGAVDGFLHIGEMSWQRIKHPSELLKEGQTVDVKVLTLDAEKKKIGLGMKQLAQNPWTTAAEKYPANSSVTGRVTRIADFGAFVELEPGLEGLIHVSELDHKHVRHTSDVVKVHQVVTAQVLEVDVDRKRVSLSLKALLARPEEHKPEEEAPSPELPRKRKDPLKGGTGTGIGKGLFGNPSDYT